MDFIENDHIKIWKEGEIFFGLLKKNSILSLKCAKEIVAMRLSFMKYRPHKAIFFMSHAAVISADARTFFATDAGYEGLLKLALVSNSQLNSMIGNLFISLNKPKIPTKLFKDKEDAIKWLLKD
jgi:hypothetical protein